jgi:hypothetical protein
MAFLYGRARRLTAKNGGFRPGQCAASGCGSFKTKGCYAYNGKGNNPGFVYFSAGGTRAQSEAKPASTKKFRLETCARAVGGSASTCVSVAPGVVKKELAKK